MARRFIVDQQDIISEKEVLLEISGSEVKHIQVLRHQVGENIIVNESICEIIEMRKDSILLHQKSLAPKKGEPTLLVTLYLAFLKNDKMDFVVQKAVELGCKKIVPFLSQNVVVKLDEKTKSKKREKLQKIADEACKQCGRTDRVIIDPIQTFSDVVGEMKEYDLSLFAYEQETKPVKEVLKCKKETCNCCKVACIVGPEGGFTLKEVERLSVVETVQTIGLGERILRAETAALNMISIIMYELE